MTITPIGPHSFGKKPYKIGLPAGNFGGQCLGDISKVGNYPKGVRSYGALDMAGNVWEWVNDWYSNSYYQTSLTRNPTGPETGSERVARGGSWLGYDWFVRSAIRGKVNPDYADIAFGFHSAVSA